MEQVIKVDDHVVVMDIWAKVYETSVNEYEDEIDIVIRARQLKTRTYG